VLQIADARNTARAALIDGPPADDIDRCERAERRECFGGQRLRAQPARRCRFGRHVRS
jgi:hypothetical protein